MMQSRRLKIVFLAMFTVVFFAPLFAFLLHKNEIVYVPLMDKVVSYTNSAFAADIPYVDIGEQETNLETSTSAYNDYQTPSESIITVAKNMISTSIQNFWDAVKGAGNAIYLRVTNTISAVVDKIQSAVSAIYNGISTALFKVYSGITSAILSVYDGITSAAVGAYDGAKNIFFNIYNGVTAFFANVYEGVTSSISSAFNAIFEIPKTIYAYITEGLRSFNAGMKKAVTGVGKTISSVPSAISTAFVNDNDDLKNFDPNIYEPAAGDEGEIIVAETYGNIEGKEEAPAPEEKSFKYEIEDKTLSVEGVLVPQSATVISSSRDGKIAKINFENGDMFQKGDILIEYECDDVQAEMDAVQAEKQLTEKRMMRNEKLFKLDIISDIEHLGFKAEDVKASAQARIVEQRIEQCYIRAAYDGRVTNKLANEHEFTRTDRVLMEVASLDDLEVEFLVPSRWLRWMNVDAPIALKVNETDEAYDAVIKRIYGEIDPVSQSIQMTAKLDEYASPLLPGMSGTITIDVARIRDAGIHGFLEQPRYSSRLDTAP